MKQGEELTQAIAGLKTALDSHVDAITTEVEQVQTKLDELAAGQSDPSVAKAIEEIKSSMQRIQDATEVVAEIIPDEAPQPSPIPGAVG